MTKPTGKPNGRPTLFNEEMANKICDRLVDETLISICSDPAMPSRVTVYRWQRDNPAFEAECARAREGLGDLMDHKIMEVGERSTPETAAADRVFMEALKWRAERMAPRKFGSRATTELTGPGGAPLIPEGAIVQQFALPDNKRDDDSDDKQG